MASVNKVMLIGNLTRDPELRYTPTGAAVCEFAIALNSSYKSKQTGEKVEEVSFIDIVAWARTAEICAEYLKKGRSVFIEGRLKQDRWETPEGKKMNRLKVHVENVQFLGAKGEAPAGEPATAAEATPPGEDIPF